MKRFKIFSLVIAAIIVLNMPLISVYAEDLDKTGFVLTDKQFSADLGGTVSCFIHTKTGAQVVWVDNNSDRREFAIGFKTPPVDSKGANHVLEHALLCGSDKYPTKNIMHYIQQGTSSLILNGVTDGDYTYYLINTSNETEYYNTLDVYLNGIFHPLFLRDENIFRQEGIRLEYDNGRAKYNGVVYNELRIENLNTEANSLTFTVDKLYRGIYGDTPPSFSSSGELDQLKQLTYQDLIKVYNTYYVPSNSMTYISGDQDINKTLELFDSFFSRYDSSKPVIRLTDTKQIPEAKVSEYNVTADTKTVDIGFMHSGVTLDSSPRELYARSIVFELIKREMDKVNSNNYIAGGKSGGIQNAAVLVSEVPVEDKDKIISAYYDVLTGFEENGFDRNELNAKISEHMEERRYSFYGRQENIFDGMLYQNDPLAFTNLEEDEKYLKEHMEYFAEILKKYFTQNPYTKIVISGNGTFGPEDIYANVTAEELEKIKNETDSFQAWADEKDPDWVVERIPFLTLDEVRDEPQVITPEYELAEGISFYNTVKADTDSADLFFALDIGSDELMTAQLMYGFMNSQKDKATIKNAYFGLLPMESYTDNQKAAPQFFIGVSGEGKAETLKSALDFIKNDSTWDAAALTEYIRSVPDRILENGYYDPYFVSYELKQSSLSAEGRFYTNTTGSIQQGSIPYYHFLKSIAPEDIPGLTEKIKALAGRLVDSKPVVEYVAENGYEEFKDEVIKIYKDKRERQSVELLLPIGYNSAAVITSLADANHFMLAGSYNADRYSGKLSVLGNVLTSKYILPEMRGKYGAYGALISFYDNRMTASVSGLSDIDLALKIWGGMGAYLRDLDMTQKELDAIIVSAVQQFDEYGYTDTECGAQATLSHKSAEDLKRVRDEMLSVTVEDLRGYADFIDELVAQNRVFAVLGREAADSAEFDFAYYADSKTLNITPMLTKEPRAYIQGKSENIFAPDDLVTRAEAAVMINRLIADKRAAQYASPFVDVTPTDWFYDAVVSLAEKGIISGYENGEFRPQNHVTGAELAAILSKFSFDEYSDISNSDQPITRAEAVTMINRMLKPDSSVPDINPFVDVDETHWAYKDILMAVSR